MMKIFDEQITGAQGLLQGLPCTDLTADCAPWEDAGKQNLVLRSEMAYELGGGTLPAVSMLGVTSSEGFCLRDNVLLYGKDLCDIATDTPYAKIVLLQADSEKLGRKEALYDTLGKLSYTRYQVNPKGFMGRISTSGGREPVRVSKVALQADLSFGHVGKLYQAAYKKHAAVQAVTVIFVTLPDFDYTALAELCKQTAQITQALDHILRDVKMDCASCGLKEVCSEVEGLRELHFSEQAHETGAADKISACN